MTRTPRRQPLILELDETPLPDAPSPADAPPVDPPATAAAEALHFAARHSGRTGLARLLALALGALLVLALGIAVTDFVEALFARGDWLGWLATGLLGLVLVLLAAICLGELAALARLGRVERLQVGAAEAASSGSAHEADRVLKGLRGLYRRRADMEWAWRRLREAEADTPDPAARLELAERVLMAPLDKAAEAAIRRASRNVAAATALIPLALVDVIAALTCNLRMIREIAEIYGGRAGWLGSWRLLRAVAAHLVATGAVAVADDLIGPLVGGGVLAKLSRRFGEGAMNGALTARVGVAAMDICRPLPFRAMTRPRAGALVLSALKDWRRETPDAGAPPDAG